MPTPLSGEAYFWKKKTFVSFLLSLLVLLIHLSSIAQYPSTGSVISIVNQKTAFFFKEAITRVAVPMFFLLSGITFFKGYDNKKYLNKMKSRIFTLGIPYLLWNVLWMLFDIVCSYTVVSNFFLARTPFKLSFINVLLGIFFYKSNGVFWYVFDLMVFAVAAPLIYLFIRNKYVGMVTVVALIVASRFGIHLPPAIFYSINSIIFYMIGGIIGAHFFHLTTKKASKPLQWGSVVFYVVYVVLKTIFVDTVSLERPVVDVIIFSICAFALWNITDLFVENLKPRTLYTRSFAIYAMHINVSAVITKLIYLCLPKSEWLAIPNFFASFVLTVAVIHYIFVFLERFVPRVSDALLGNRTKPQKT